MTQIAKLSLEELSRYSRHLSIPEFGIEGQLKLKEAKILVIGAGGLGSPCLLYLAAAGIGTIGIVDYDMVDESNLQRQILYSTHDIGKSKAQTAKVKLLELNPHIIIQVHNDEFDTKNALALIENYDVIIDGTDNFPTRYLVNDACVLAGKVLIYGSIFRFEGQVTVFNMPWEDGSRGPNYRDLYPEPPPPALIPNCAEGGVLGVLPGIIGSMQASEAIKVVTGIGEPLSGRVFIFDASSFTSRVLKIGRNSRTSIEKLINYRQFCGLPKQKNHTSQMKEITVQELKQLIDDKADYQLIDVRESYENDIATLNGELIPMNTVFDNVDRISKDKKVIIHCRSGQRSGNIILALQEKLGYDNLYNLKGGIMAWSREIDPSVPIY